jgi:hypothetical protein
MKNSLSLKILMVSWILSTLAYIANINLDPSILTFAATKLGDLSFSLFYQFLCVFLLGFGILKGNNHSQKKFITTNPNFVHHKKTLVLNIFIVILISVSVLLSGYLTLKLSGFSGDLESQREYHIDSYAKSGGPAVYFSQYSVNFGVILLTVLPWVSNIKLLTKFFVSLLIFLGIFFTGLSSGSRGIILSTFILPLGFSCLAFALNKQTKTNNKIIVHKNTKKQQRKNTLIYISGIIIFLFILVAFMIWQYLRSYSSFEVNVLVNMKPYTDFVRSIRIPEEYNMFVAFSIRNILIYLSSGIENFSYFFNYYSEFPLFGGYQFNFISSKITAPGTWLEWKDNIEYSYKHYGLFWNVWGTFVREYVVDFGRLPALFFSYLTGYLIGKCEKLLYRRKTFPLISLYTLSLSWLSMSPSYSLLVIRPFHTAIITIVVVVMFNSLYNKKPSLL